MRRSFYYLTLFLLIPFISKTQENLMSCWNRSYTDFSFKERMDKFHLELINNGNVSTSDARELEKLLRSLKNAEENHLPKLIQGEFISETPFETCLETHVGFEINATARKYGLLFSLYYRSSLPLVTIPIIVYEEKISVKNEIVNIDILNDTLVKIREQFDSDIKDEIILKMTVDENVKMGLIIGIQDIVRKVGFRKVVYVNLK